MLSYKSFHLLSIAVKILPQNLIEEMQIFIYYLLCYSFYKPESQVHPNWVLWLEAVPEATVRILGCLEKRRFGKMHAYGTGSWWAARALPNVSKHVYNSL